MTAAALVNIINDEVNSAYAEEIASNERVWEYVLKDEPTAKEKVIAFFTKQTTDPELVGLSYSAKKYLKNFKEMFNKLSEEQQGTNALKSGGKTVLSTNKKNVQVTGKTIKASNDNRYALDKDFLSFIENVLEMKNKSLASKRRYTIGEISISHAQLIEDIFASELNKGNL